MNGKYLVLDFEGANSNRICSIAYCEADGTSVGKVTKMLINPGCRIGVFERKVNKITDWQVKDKPKLDEVWPQIEKYFKGDYIIVGHGVKGDLDLLARHLYHYGINLPELTYICTQGYARSAGFEKLKLQDVYGAVTGQSDLNWHDAAIDAEATAVIFNYLLERKQPNLKKYAFDVEVYLKKQTYKRAVGSVGKGKFVTSKDIVYAQKRFSLDNFNSFWEERIKNKIESRGGAVVAAGDYDYLVAADIQKHKKSREVIFSDYVVGQAKKRGGAFIIREREISGFSQK